MIQNICAIVFLISVQEYYGVSVDIISAVCCMFLDKKTCIICRALL